MKLPELKEKAKELGLSAIGKKQEILERIQEALADKPAAPKGKGKAKAKPKAKKEVEPEPEEEEEAEAEEEDEDGGVVEEEEEEAEAAEEDDEDKNIVEDDEEEEEAEKEEEEEEVVEAPKPKKGKKAAAKPKAPKAKKAAKPKAPPKGKKPKAAPKPKKGKKAAAAPKEEKEVESEVPDYVDDSVYTISGAKLYQLLTEVLEKSAGKKKADPAKELFSLLVDFKGGKPSAPQKEANKGANRVTWNSEHQRFEDCEGYIYDATEGQPSVFAKASSDEKARAEGRYERLNLDDVKALSAGRIRVWHVDVHKQADAPTLAQIGELFAKNRELYKKKEAEKKGEEGRGREGGG